MPGSKARSGLNSFEQSKMPTEQRLSEFVGLETYLALYHRWPGLYKQINFPMTPSRVYVELVDSVALSTGLDFEEAGLAIRSDIIRLMELDDLPTTYSPARKLVASSQAIYYTKNSPASAGLLIIAVTTLFFVLTTLVCMSGLLNWWTYPAKSASLNAGLSFDSARSSSAPPA